MYDTGHMKWTIYIKLKQLLLRMLLKHDEIKSIDLCRQRYIMDERLHHMYMYLRFIFPIWYQNTFYHVTSRAGVIQRHAIKSINHLWFTD